MAFQEHHPHVLHLPRFFTIIKYIQLVISVLLIALSAFCVYLIAFSAHAYTIFVSLYTTGIIIYYLVASKASPKSYNWIALLVLEVLAVIFWLATWAVLGALYAALALIGSTYDSYDYYYYYRVKRSLEARDVYSYGLAYAGCLIAAIALAVINLYVHRSPSTIRPWLTTCSASSTSSRSSTCPAQSTATASPACRCVRVWQATQLPATATTSQSPTALPTTTRRAALRFRCSRCTPTRSTTLSPRLPIRSRSRTRPRCPPSRRWSPRACRARFRRPIRLKWVWAIVERCMRRRRSATEWRIFCCVEGGRQAMISTNSADLWDVTCAVSFSEEEHGGCIDTMDSCLIGKAERS